jgi:hypothetical protein
VPANLVMIPMEIVFYSKDLMLFSAWAQLVVSYEHQPRSIMYPSANTYIHVDLGYTIHTLHEHDGILA